MEAIFTAKARRLRGIPSTLSWKNKIIFVPLFNERHWEVYKRESDNTTIYQDEPIKILSIEQMGKFIQEFPFVAEYGGDIFEYCQAVMSKVGSWRDL